jgi:MFS family permease
MPFLVSAGFLLTLRVPAMVRTLEQMTFLAELRAGWREVRSRTWLWVMMLRAMLVLFVTIAPLQVLGPMAITERHQSPALWGLLVGLFSLGMLVGGLITLYYRPRRPMVTVALCGTTAVAPMLALALALSPGLLVTIWFVRGIAIGVLSAVWNASLQSHIAYESMARVSSWDWMTSGGLWPIGLVIAGPIAAAIGVTDALWWATIFGVACSVWVLFVKDVWRLRGPAAPAID